MNDPQSRKEAFGGISFYQNVRKPGVLEDASMRRVMIPFFREMHRGMEDTNETKPGIKNSANDDFEKRQPRSGK